MNEINRTVITPQQCAQEMFAMLVDTPKLDSWDIKTFFNLGFLKTWTVADIQDEIYCLKAMQISVIVWGAFGYEKARKIIPEFQLLIYAAARQKPLFSRVERHFPNYWNVIEKCLDRSWNGTAANFPLDTVAPLLGDVFAKHCGLKHSRESVNWVINTLKSTLPAVEDLRAYEIT